MCSGARWPNTGRGGLPPSSSPGGDGGGLGKRRLAEIRKRQVGAVDGEGFVRWAAGVNADDP